MKFSIKNVLCECDQSCIFCVDLVTFAEKIFIGKLYLLCSAVVLLYQKIFEGVCVVVLFS